MGMNIQQPDSDDDSAILSDLNLTPLIDIMLVLLIIFMVTSSISLESGLDIDLPKTSSSTQSKSSNSVIISLDQAGSLSVQGKKIEFSQLKEVLTQTLQQEKSDEVIFEGDNNATLGRMIEIMDISKTAGAERFSVATEAKAESASPPAPTTN